MFSGMKPRIMIDKSLDFKSVLTVLGVLLSSVAIFAQTHQVEGEVMGLWNADTIKVTGNIFLPPGSSLSIEAGVVVQFQGFYGFKVDGSLQALGTAALPVVFTVNDTTGLHNVYAPGGGWSGIHMVAVNEEDNITAIFDHCHFEYAKTWAEDTLLHGGAIYLSGPVNASFQHCTFFHNRAFLSGAGIYFKGASPLVENCLFTGNQSGHIPVVEDSYGYGGGICGINTKAVIRGNVFFDNWSTGIGGGLSIDNGDPTIENNIFEGNDSPLGGGFGILRSQVLGTIANNLVLNNTSMFFGGGIALITTRANLANNTIVNNYATYGGGLFFNFESFVKVYNSILWGNTSNGDYGGSVFIWDGISVPDFFNCNIEGGLENFDGATFLGQYIDNINEDPLFKTQGEHPWQLEPYSPSINTGIEDHSFLNLPGFDLAGNPRVQLGRIDMGAYESDIILSESIQHTYPSAMRLKTYPNPVRETATITLQNEQAGIVRIFLVNTYGQKLLEVFEGFLEPGIHEFVLTTLREGFGKGVYFVVAARGDEKATERLLIMP
jgi:hypothetical protein